MADTLVERLRQADTNSQQRVLGSRIFGEAADLIAALEHQLAEARAEIDVQRESKKYAQRCCEAAEAERARLAADKLASLEKRELVGRLGQSATGGNCYLITDAGRAALEASNG